MRMEIDHPIEGKVPNIGFAVKLSGTPQQVRRHPPLLGEHTAEVLAEMGIDEHERARLEAQGAFACMSDGTVRLSIDAGRGHRWCSTGRRRAMR